MDSFNGNNVWDLSLPTSSLTLADDEFIALLQKQFGVSNDIISRELGGSSAKNDASATAPPQVSNINPQSLTRFPTPPGATTPDSDDSSPSPLSYNEPSSSKSKRQSGAFGDGVSQQVVDDDSAPKRKASMESLDDEPTQKSQHTSGSRKASASSIRRKSTGHPSADDSRLLKRKEQNRAAQRAFRERKEKHVKDLEDKVAQLEEKNTSAHAENESLREVISRLQGENMRLRQASFTFTVPAKGSEAASKKDSSRGASAEARSETSMNLFNSPPSGPSSSSASTHDSPQSLFISDSNDSPLTFFGQGLTVMDPEPQQTATNAADAMGIDFGFGPLVSHTPYTTIASNPLFMSFREPDPTNLFAQSNTTNAQFDFSQQGYMGWPDINMSDTSLSSFDVTGSLDELFGSSYLSTPSFDYGSSVKSPSSTVSPVAHQSSVKSPGSISSGASSGSSPASSGASPAASGSSASCNGKCTKKDLAAAVAKDPGSMFAPPVGSSPVPPPEGLESATCSADGACPELVPCKGLQLPKTQRNEKNLEVMKAWRAIRHDPNYQDIDINQLCSEFASKAKCDGCQVVIEPSSMQEILETVTKAKKSKQLGLTNMSSLTSVGLN